MDSGTCDLGRGCAPPACLCSQGKVLRWPWWPPISWRENFIARTETIAEAFARYQSLFGPFVRGKQKAALRFAGFFAPKSKFSLFLRNQVIKLLDFPWIADLTVGRDIADRIPLPHY